MLIVQVCIVQLTSLVHVTKPHFSQNGQINHNA